MRTLIVSAILLAILSQSLAIRRPQRPLRAMLYCYLPAVNTADPNPEYQRLAEIINQKLKRARINVRVEVCDKEKDGSALYNETAINSLFDKFDILEVDVSYLWAITEQTELVSFSRNEIDYYDKVFQFEWEPTTVIDAEGEERIIGSPGLLCSTFLETREGNHVDRLYGKFKASSAYGLVDLYLNLFINGDVGRTLDSVDYTDVDDDTIAQVANFLKDCQDDNSVFDYENNWCLIKTKNFLDTNYSTTTGYSENLFNFQNAGIESDYVKIEHITQGAQRKVFYVDSFVAKAGSNRKTVLDFYKFMISDEIIDIYVQGTYTNNPATTYLLPPTKSYLRSLSQVDGTYQSIRETAFSGLQLPLFQKQFSQNVYKFAELIDCVLQGTDKEQCKQK